MSAPPVVIAADLLPWWFAAGFWVAFVALVAMAVRDVRRAGGIRRFVRSVRQAIDERGGPDATDHDRPVERPDV